MVTIRMMKESERDMVSAFVQRAMRGRYGSDAYALPEFVFTAWQGGEVIGVMAFSISRGEPFHLEHAYALDYATFPGVFDRTKIIQLGRWVATVPNVAEILLREAVAYALRAGYEWGIGEIKAPVARRYARLGVRIVLLRGEPDLNNIPAGVLPYYLASPQPMPAAIALADACRALDRKAEGIHL